MIDKQYFPLIEAVHCGGRVVRKYFKKIISVEVKDNQVCNVRTVADMESQAAIVKKVRSAFPRWHIKSEEDYAHDGNGEYRAIIDPLDGTHNFSIGKSYCSVSLAVTKGKETIVGIVHDPFDNRTFCAQKGRGSYLNGDQLHVSNTTSLSSACISYISGYNVDEALFAHFIAESTKGGKIGVKRGVKRVLTEWSPGLDLALMAAGKIDAVICVDPEYDDKLAGKLMIQEAGGVITNLQGQSTVNLESLFVAASTPELHREVLQIFHNAHHSYTQAQREL